MQLNLVNRAVFILRVGQWKSTQANKDGSQSPNLGNWTVILFGDSWKNWRVYIPLEYFTQSFTNAAILIQFYFDLCNCWVARAQHALVHICLKIMLVDSSAMERKLPLQFISSSFMTHSLFYGFASVNAINHMGNLWVILQPRLLQSGFKLFLIS